VIFPGDPLLCAGKSRSLFATRARHVWCGRLAQLPHFSDGFLISCGLAGAFSDYFGSIA
jgi:hypothetical protein